MSLTKWLYEPDFENTVRYVLGTHGENPLVCFGINPSTAEPENLDNTLKSVQRLSENNGFDSWMMFNVYPQRSTNPNGMHEQMDRSIHQRNLEAIGRTLALYSKPTIWAAWGTLIEKRTYLAACLKDIHNLSLNHDCNWVSIGAKSLKGHPHHPLYLRSNATPEPFDVEGYLDSVLI